MKTVIAYAVTFILAPIIGEISTIIFLPILAVFKGTRLIGIIWFIVHVFVGFFIVWAGKWIFSWFGLKHYCPVVS